MIGGAPEIRGHRRPPKHGLTRGGAMSAAGMTVLAAGTATATAAYARSWPPGVTVAGVLLGASLLMLAWAAGWHARDRSKT